MEFSRAVLSVRTIGRICKVKYNLKIGDTSIITFNAQFLLFTFDSRTLHCTSWIWESGEDLKNSVLLFPSEPLALSFCQQGGPKHVTQEFL